MNNSYKENNKENNNEEILLNEKNLFLFESLIKLFEFFDFDPKEIFFEQLSKIDLKENSNFMFKCISKDCNEKLILNNYYSHFLNCCCIFKSEKNS